MLPEESKNIAFKMEHLTLLQYFQVNTGDVLSALMFYAPEIHREPWSINMIHDENKCIVK
jgi:hypothetical protein